MLHVLQLHDLSRSKLQIDRTNTMNRSMRPIPHQDGIVVCDLVRGEKVPISTHMNICTCINPPICGLTDRKYAKQITIPRCTLSVAHGHIDRLRVLSWLLLLVWALVCPMFLRTTSKATIFCLLLTLLLE